jgi:glycosyltransferase involved in cell wall biosynthesis
MTGTRRRGEFTRHDPLSELLIDLTADRLQGWELSLTPGAIELAQRHGLISLLADLTRDDLVRAIQARESARRKVLEAHLRGILEHFADSGIAAAVLKGPSIAGRYRNPHHRQFSDIDLLVPDQDVSEALDALADYPNTVRVPPKRPKADKRDVLIEDDSGVRFNLDLHWDLFSYSQLRSVADGATETAWKEAVFDAGSQLGPVWEIPDAYRVAFLATHAVLDHRFRLILFRDFLELSLGGIGWSELEQVSRQWGLRSTTYLALWLSRELVGAEVDEGFLDDVRPASLPLNYLERTLPRTDIVRFDGHRPRPVNLASVLLHDSPRAQLSLLVRAPRAFPAWHRRVAGDGAGSSMPRTLIVVSTDRRRGAEVFTERLRDGLVRRGWVAEAVALIGTTESSRANVEVLTPAVEVSGGRLDWRVLVGLVRKIRAFRPDLVVANGGSTLRYGFLATVLSRVRLAYISIGEPDYWIRSGLSRWVNRLMLRHTDLILSVSEETRRQTIHLEPSVEGRVHTTWTGLPDELFRIRRQAPAGPLRILMVGSLSHEKDPELALAALALLTEAKLRFVGDGPLRDELEQIASRLAVSDRVEFTGSVNDVTPHLEWAHVLLLTSRSEGLPGAILEAGAAGIPTVAVDVGGVTEAVSDGVGGFVTERDPDAIAAALSRLDDDRALLEQLGSQARAETRERFAMDLVIDRYERLLAGLAR